MNLKPVSVEDIVEETLNNIDDNFKSVGEQLAETTQKFGLKKNIMDYGIKNDGSTPSRSLIQLAEDEASALANSLGVEITLEFPNGVYMTEGTINKKSKVNWIGEGKIVRNPQNTTTLYALVLADGQKDFVISGVKFSNLPHHIAHSISSSWSKAVRNCCIHLYECENVIIDKCSFENYSEGIVRTACKGYKIINNYLNSKVQGKEIGQFLNDNYSDIAGAQTGDITGWVLQDDAGKMDEDFIISGNHCLSIGLRIGIEVMTQSATASRGIISNNIVKGLHHGIKLYKGTYGTLINAVTNVKQTIIANNHVSFCREIGIYIRANLGTLIANNFVTHCGLFNTGAGTAFGGIVSRISAETTDANSSLDAGNLIIGNYVYNSGKAQGNTVEPRGIHVRNASGTVKSNVIVQDTNVFTIKNGVGITVGLGDNSERFNISDNKIINFSIGIDVNNTLITEEIKSGIIKNNEIRNVTTGVRVDLSHHTIIECNTFFDFSAEGIRIRNARETMVKDNIFKSGGVCIMIASGTFSDNSTRTGATNKVFRNVAENTSSFASIIETAVGDTTFAGRCKYYADNLVNWVRTPA